MTAIRQLFLPSMSQTSADLLSRICMSQVSQDPGQMQGQADSQRRVLSHTEGWGMQVLHIVQSWLSPNSSKYLPFLVGVRRCIQIYLRIVHTQSSMIFLIFSCFSGKVMSYRPLQYTFSPKEVQWVWQASRV